MGIIELENNRIIEWKTFSVENPPELPFGSTVELEIACNPDEFLSGNDGIVWAAYDKRQVEVIHNALMAQHINSEVKIVSASRVDFYFIKITNKAEVNSAIDFIWRSVTGLRLKPDWSYLKGEPNRSFEQWLHGQ